MNLVPHCQLAYVPTAKSVAMAMYRGEMTARPFGTYTWFIYAPAASS